MYNNSFLNNLENDYTKILKARRHEVVEFLNRKKYKYFVTVTFKSNPNQRECEIYLKAIIKMVNKEYFGKRYKRKFLEGILFVEKHNNHEFHFHILFEDNYIFQKKSYKNFEQVFKKKAEAIYKSFSKDKKYYPIDVKNGVDIQEYYDGGILDYLTKNIEYHTCNFDFITFLDKDGFIDYPDLRESFRF